jgi:hypothetical protein
LRFWIFRDIVEFGKEKPGNCANSPGRAKPLTITLRKDLTMSSNTKLSRPTQWISGIVLMSAAVSAGGLSLYFNLTSGLALGVGVAIAFGLSDVSKIALPIVCQAIGWTKHLRLTYYTATAVSIICAVCYLADRFGTDLVSKERANQGYEDNGRRIAELESRLSDSQAMVVAEASKGGCGPRCEALKADVSRTDAALANARAARTEIKPEKIDGKSAVFSWATGADKDDVSRGSSALLIFAVLLMSEMLCHTSSKAASMIGEAMKPRKKATVQKSRKVAKPKRKTERQVKMLKAFAEPPKLTKSGKIDGRTKSARAVKRVVATKVLA